MAFKKKLKRQHFSSRQKNMLEIPKFITKQKRKNQILPNSTPYFYLYFSRRLQKSINGGRNSKNTQHPIRPVITNQSPSTSISLSLSLSPQISQPSFPLASLSIRHFRCCSTCLLNWFWNFSEEKNHQNKILRHMDTGDSTVPESKPHLPDTLQ